jgi:hypothetical protein
MSDGGLTRPERTCRRLSGQLGNAAPLSPLLRYILRIRDPEMGESVSILDIETRAQVLGDFNAYAQAQAQAQASNPAVPSIERGHIDDQNLPLCAPSPTSDVLDTCAIPSHIFRPS